MAKFANKTMKTGTRGPSKVVWETPTFEGASGYKLDNKSALFLIAATSMVGEDSFYESAEVRDGRFRNLVHSVTDEDPGWVLRFIPFLRNEMNMRSASVVVACEYLAAGGPGARDAINDACVRADEPAEILAYWMSEYYGWDGHSYPLPAPKLPQALRKGLGDAVKRLYTERAVVKWNGNSRGISMGNVLDLIHPKTNGPNPVFKYIVDKHHGNTTDISELKEIKNLHELQNINPALRRDILNTPLVLRNAGMTWEGLSGWLGGPMNAQAWEAMIEAGMGYMALLRNLRNFEQTGISRKHRDMVINKLTNPEEVASSRQFPYRFYSAYKMLKESGYLNFLPAVDEALNLSTDNIPSFGGRSLVLSDTSGSMTWGGPSRHSNITMMEIAALFAVAMARKNNADLYAFATTTQKVHIPQNSSVLSGIDKVRGTNVGGGTDMMGAINKQYRGHDRIVILSDMQSHPGNMNQNIPLIHAFDLSGYNRTPLEIGAKGRYQYGGWSDKMFNLMVQLENFHTGTWPF